MKHNEDRLLVAVADRFGKQCTTASGVWTALTPIEQRSKRKGKPIAQKEV